MSHLSMRHVTLICASCHIHLWVTSHSSMSHVTLISESRISHFLWITSNYYMRHFTFTYASCHIYLRVMSRTGYGPSQRSWRYDLRMAPSERLAVVIDAGKRCQSSHPLQQVFNTSVLLEVTCLIHTCDMTHLRDMTHSSIPIAASLLRWHASFIRVTWPIQRCDMWRDSFIHVTWPIHTCDVMHSYMWRDSFMHVRALSPAAANL